MGGALTSLLELGERCTTLEVKIRYLAPAASGGLRWPCVMTATAVCIRTSTPRDGLTCFCDRARKRCL
jgi:acyl-coenzyme A thioesterase PaaI-like protein